MSRISQPNANHIVIDRHIRLCEADAVIAGRLSVHLHPQSLSRCAKSHARLTQAIAEKRHVYGISTGFGPLANRLVDPADGVALQQNLVFHLASGVGPDLDWAAGRGLVLARLLSILQGASGASPMAINALVTLLNSGLSPCVPSKGTVGASGDLTPLAHMVLCFQGQGAFQTQNGTRLCGQDGLKHLQLTPLDLAKRDGLALVNGTSAMTGIAVINAAKAKRCVKWAVALTAAMAETQGAHAEAWDHRLAALRPHPGQLAVTQDLNAAIAGSERIIRVPLAARRLDGPPLIEAEAGQDAYTLRCAPQVIGAVSDALTWHDQIVSTELCAATDNPIFPEPPETDDLVVLHGGNFMGQHVGLASDALGNALCVLAGLAERQVARLTDEKLNRGLPAFLHEGQPGIQSGLMGAQVTATALLAEMRLPGAASAQSISTNGANQDVVSMGTIAARQVQDRLVTLSQIQAILALAVAQAIDLREDKDPTVGFSKSAQDVRHLVRQHSARLVHDRPLGSEITTLADHIAKVPPPLLRS